MNKLIKHILKYKILLFIILLIGIAIYTGNNLLNKNDNNTTSNTSTTKVKKGTITSSIETSGTIETANYLSITTSVNGIVKKVFVKEGDYVTKGQKIMEITLNADGEESLSSAWANYLSAKNSLENAKSTLLTKKNSLISSEDAFEAEKENNSYQTEEERKTYTKYENEYLVAKSSYEQQEQSIKIAEVSLQKAWLSYQSQSPTVVAPDSGNIANILVVEGMDISNSLSEKTSLTVASIKKEGSPIASLSVSEVDINKVKVGQKVKLELNAIKDKTFEGEIVGIDKIGTTSNGVATYTVIVKFKEENQNILPNMGVDAEIILDEKQNTMYIDTAAITVKDSKYYVTDESNNTIEIETGITTTKYTEITKGLNEGETLLIKNLSTTGFTDTQKNNNNNFPSGGIGGDMLR